MAYTIKIYFLTVLEPGSPRSRSQEGWFLLRPLFWAFRWLPSCCLFTSPFLDVHTQISDVSSPSFKDSRFFGLGLNIITSLKALSPHTGTLRFQAPIFKFGGNKVQSITNIHTHTTQICLLFDPIVLGLGYNPKTFLVLKYTYLSSCALLSNLTFPSM